MPKSREEKQRQARAKRLWDCFKLTLEDYELILRHQNGVCFICNHSQKSGKNLAVDHCHGSGLVRALLCSNCNRIAGRLERAKWNKEVLLRVIEYFSQPPAVKALGREVFGYAGRVGTKKHRAAIRKEKQNNS